jgi:hypothetical protein
MLYTVVPLEQIYRSVETESKQSNSEHSIEYKEFGLKYGKARARRDGEKYIVEHIESTDMSDYLRDDIYPGSVIVETTDFDVSC